jgi:hypothetical protein
MSEKGVPSGVLVFKSLDSGKEFKLGPSQLGNHEVVNELLAKGSELIGRVAKVKSRVGHEGRASVFKDWHLDK